MAPRPRLRRKVVHRPISDLDRDDCEKFYLDRFDFGHIGKLVNPLTGRFVDKDGPTTLRICRKCCNDVGLVNNRSEICDIKDRLNASAREKYKSKNRTVGSRYKAIKIHYPKTPRKHKTGDSKLNSWQLFLRNVAPLNKDVQGRRLLTLKQLGEKYREFVGQHEDVTAEGAGREMTRFFKHNILPDTDTREDNDEDNDEENDEDNEEEEEHPRLPKSLDAAGKASASKSKPKNRKSQNRPPPRIYDDDDDQEETHLLPLEDRQYFHIPRDHPALRQQGITLQEALSIINDEIIMQNAEKEKLQKRSEQQGDEFEHRFAKDPTFENAEDLKLLSWQYGFDEREVDVIRGSSTFVYDDIPNMMKDMFQFKFDIVKVVRTSYLKIMDKYLLHQGITMRRKHTPSNVYDVYIELRPQLEFFPGHYVISLSPFDFRSTKTHIDDPSIVDISVLIQRLPSTYGDLELDKLVISRIVVPQRFYQLQYWWQDLFERLTRWKDLPRPGIEILPEFEAIYNMTSFVRYLFNQGYIMSTCLAYAMRTSPTPSDLDIRIPPSMRQAQEEFIKRYQAYTDILLRRKFIC